ncbi:hypothetical protein H4R99_002343 [Coemansia sp. RSA 1722]|nr:hypothetical protein LPJ57_005770 [Coemansia sp. RSA 486]KAJ2237994.1 hypothetical protein IWW45_000469 [Coemansia sp. RSA 485]KAJ2603514.1 hypothetical protein H4R99_002343 [Coemansia sp. RSA 1722]
MPSTNSPSASAAGTSNADIPKIQLESKEDVHFLQNQLNDYLTRALEKNTALRDGPFTDEQREQARQLVLANLQKWTSNVWTMAGDSMSINGFSYEEAMREKSRIEPLDEGLKTEVQTLRDEADSLLLSVANKRRTVPEQIERLSRDGVWRESVVAENTREIRGLKKADAAEDNGELPYVDDRINSEFESSAVAAKKISAAVDGAVGRVQRLAEVLQDTRARVEKDAEEDGNVRRVLLGVGASTANGLSTDAQMLAQKAALHAISPDS